MDNSVPDNSNLQKSGRRNYYDYNNYFEEEYLIELTAYFFPFGASDTLCNIFLQLELF